MYVSLSAAVVSTLVVLLAPWLLMFSVVALLVSLTVTWFPDPEPVFNVRRLVPEVSLTVKPLSFTAEALMTTPTRPAKLIVAGNAVASVILPPPIVQVLDAVSP